MSEKDFLDFWEIYDNAFPKEEKRLKKEQRQLLNNENYKIHLYRDEDEVVGFITLWKLGVFNFIEHFAIKENYRGNGLGSKIIKDIISKYGKKLILEVELPENNISQKRIKFYEKAGFYYNDYTYKQPPYRKDCEPVDLSIMSYPNPISKDEFTHSKHTLYRYVYNVN